MGNGKKGSLLVDCIGYRLRRKCLVSHYLSLHKDLSDQEIEFENEINVSAAEKIISIMSGKTNFLC